MAAKPKPKPDSFDAYHWHEALDRTFTVADSFDRFVCDHPVVSNTRALRQMAYKASAAMADLYQAIGRLDPHNQE